MNFVKIEDVRRTQVQRRGEGKRHLEGPRGGGEGGVSRVYGTAEARVTGAVGSRRPLEDAAASDAGPRSHPSEVLGGRRPQVPPGYSLRRGTLIIVTAQTTESGDLP